MPDLVREHRLSAHDLIYPVFVLDGERQREVVRAERLAAIRGALGE